MSRASLLANQPITRYYIDNLWYFLMMKALEEQIPAYSIETLKTRPSGLVRKREVDVFKFEYFARDIEHLKAPHRHQFYTFVLLLSGSGSHDIDFTTYPIQRNRLFLISPGQVHAWNELREVTGYMVIFTDSFVALSKGRKLLSAWPLFRVGQASYIDLTNAETLEWVKECRFMETEMHAPDPFSRDAVFYAIGKLLVRASRLYASRADTETQGLLFRFQELVELHFMEKRMPKEYATLLNVSANHLNAIVKKKSGKSAGELIRQRTVLEAKRSLAHTQLSVAEIAFQLGFKDNSYFGRFFRKYAGSTPQQFREEQQT